MGPIYHPNMSAEAVYFLIEFLARNNFGAHTQYYSRLRKNLHPSPLFKSTRFLNYCYKNLRRQVSLTYLRVKNAREIIKLISSPLKT